MRLAGLGQQDIEKGIGRETVKACACPPEGAAQIAAGEELLLPCFTGSKSKCNVSLYGVYLCSV